MPDKPYTKLRITKLSFISAVDVGAQGPVANVALIKRAPQGDEFEAVCKVALASEVPINGEPMGIVFGWALASTLDGGKTEHVDLQRDAVVGDDHLIKIAAAFMEAGGAADTMHTNEQDGKVLFCLPLTADVLKALGIQSNVHGLAIGMKPSPETFKRFQSGELGAFSIAGVGERTPVSKSSDVKCAKCSAYMKSDDAACPKCGVEKYNPDQARDHGKFSSGGGGGDSTGMSASQHSDHAEHHARESVVSSSRGDLKGGEHHASLATEHAVHATNAARASGSASDHRAAWSAHEKASFAAAGVGRTGDMQRHAASADYHAHESAPKTSGVDSIKPTKPTSSSGASPGTRAGVDSIKPRRTKKNFAKQAVLTSVADGHQHQINLNDPSRGWNRDSLATSYNTSDGADNGHCHAWVYDPATGAITIAEDSGHSHTVDAVVPADVLAEAAASMKCCPRCNGMCDSDDRYCPNCGGAMGDTATPTAVEDEGSGPKVIAISLRAPDANSPPSEAGSSVNNENKEHAPMATDALQILTKKHEDLEKENTFLRKFSQLTDAEKAHHGKLVGQDQDVFLNKSALERQVEISEIAKADEVIYTSPVTGEVFRKSCSPRELKLQKQADEATIALRVESQKRADGELARKGDELLSAFTKGAKGNLKGRLMKAINAEFTDPTDYEEVIEAMKGMNAAMVEASKPKGYTPKVDVSEIADPSAQLETLAKRYSEENKVGYAKAFAHVLTTPQGAALYAAADKVARA